MDTDVMFSQATDVWGTPQWLFDALDGGDVHEQELAR
jgi:hypothetical protein